MKKLVVLALGLLMGMSAFAGPQGEDNGFGLKLFAGLHGDKYGRVVDAKISKDAPKASPTLGFAIDNRWYVANPGKAGVAINVRWADFSYSRFKYSFAGQRETAKTKIFDYSVLGIGPLGTYYLDDKMAVDLYYNIAPNMYVLSRDGYGDDYVSFAFGASHRIGAAYRINVFQAGLEFRGGKLSYQDWGDDKNMALTDSKIHTGALRIFVGFKF